MNIKVKDLAKMLKLSPSTVSMVLNNKPGISQATRDKVLMVAKELGAIEPVLHNEGKNILFIVYRKHGIDKASTPYFSQLFLEIIEGVESQVKLRGYNLMISYIDEKTIQEEAYNISKKNVHGVLVLATEMFEEQISIFEDLKIPLLIMDNYMQEKELNCITINNDKGVHEVIKHFIKMGHKRIGYLHVSNNANNFTERYYGYIRELEKNQMTVNPDDIYEIVTEGGDAVYKELKDKLLGKEDLPTAFFADNDITAMFAMRVFRELGYKIPEDISIIGFDNMSLSELLDTPLTTVFRS